MKTLLALLIFLPGLLYSDSPVSISILSILGPKELTVTVIEPERALLRSNGSQSVLLSKAPLKVKFENAPALSISCGSSCTMELSIPDKISRRYRGNLELTPGRDAINIILHTSQEELLGSLSASEMGEFKESAALEAFAVVSRSFLRAGRRHPEIGADFCDLTHCQVFQSYPPSPEAIKAVQETTGLILTYQQKAFRPYYFRSCGGRTATFEEVWKKKSPDYPFTSVVCPCNTTWQAQFTVSQLQIAAGFPLKRIQQNRNQLELTSEDHKISYTLEEFRNVVGRTLGWNKIKSNSFHATQQGANLHVSGKGIGHRVGFCQRGAVQMARSGKSFQEILQHYFPNGEIRAGH